MNGYGYSLRTSNEYDFHAEGIWHVLKGGVESCRLQIGVESWRLQIGVES
jgi:hypothetical protein